MLVFVFSDSVKITPSPDLVDCEFFITFVKLELRSTVDITEPEIENVSLASMPKFRVPSTKYFGILDSSLEDRLKEIKVRNKMKKFIENINKAFS